VSQNEADVATQTNATIADVSLAWPFVLNGTWKSGKFTGRLVSPDGHYTFSVHPPPEGWVGVVGRVRRRVCIRKCWPESSYNCLAAAHHEPKPG